ncbi:MAG: hypothetical protein VYD70_05590 [Planctomycetota bacterium]|nr:hypothetical protein [Planctomycetota bacterium]
MVLNTRTLSGIFLGLSVALFAGGCSDSVPVKGSEPVKEVPTWHENVAAGTVAIRDVGPEDAPQQKAWEFGIGSPCRVSWGIVGSRGSGGVSTSLGAPHVSSENTLPVPAKSLVKLQFSTEEIEGRTVLDNLGVLVGKDVADEVLKAHPELADSTLLRFSTKCDAGAALVSSEGFVPGSVQVTSDSSGFRMMSGKRGPRNSQLGTTIYLAHHISYDQSGTGGIKEVDGGCCLEVIDEGGNSQFVPIREYQLPAWVFWVKFEAVE